MNPKELCYPVGPNLVVAPNGWGGGLAGERLSLYQEMSPPADEQIIGCVLLLHTIIDHQPYLYITRETMAKQHFWKEPGDWSPIAGGRNLPVSGVRESVAQAIVREVWEEAGLTPEQYDVGRRIGWYFFPNDGNHLWITAYEGFVPPHIVFDRDLGPLDGETEAPRFVTPETYLKALPVRGAMGGIVADWYAGKTGVVAQATPGVHDRNVVFEYSYK